MRASFFSGKGTAGKIFPEYWVDCHRCRTAKACCENDRDAAARSAREMDWRQIDGLWTCSECQKPALANEQNVRPTGEKL